MQGAPGSSTLESSAPGSLVLVREDERLVTHVDQTRDGTLITCQGLSKFVAGTTAQFFEGLDTITPSDPRDTTVVAHSSRNHHGARLWLEATLRKTALPIENGTSPCRTRCPSPWSDWARCSKHVRRRSKQVFIVTLWPVLKEMQHGLSCRAAQQRARLTLPVADAASPSATELPLTLFPLTVTRNSFDFSGGRPSGRNRSGHR